MVTPYDANARDANLREWHAQLHAHLRATEDRHHQIFVTTLAVSAALMGLSPGPGVERSDAWLWFVVGVLAMVAAGYMHVLQVWKRRYHRRISRVRRRWGIEREFNPFRGRGKGADMILMAAIIAMAIVAFTLFAISLTGVLGAEPT